MRTVWSSIALAACTAPADGLADEDGDGLVAANDCADDDASIYPGADEVIGDGIDQDCDGFETCFADADADGFHGDATVEDADLACSAPGAVDAAVPGGDCADDDAGRNPGAAEVCGGADLDEDCDGFVDGDDPDTAACFDSAGTYTGPVEIQFGIDFAFGSKCLGTATAEVDPKGAIVITGTCTPDDEYAEEFGTLAVTGSGNWTGTWLASGSLQVGEMPGTGWTGELRSDLLTVRVSDGFGYINGRSVQYDGQFTGELQ